MADLKHSQVLAQPGGAWEWGPWAKVRVPEKGKAQRREPFCGCPLAIRRDT